MESIHVIIFGESIEIRCDGNMIESLEKTIEGYFLLDLDIKVSSKGLSICGNNSDLYTLMFFLTCDYAVTLE